ARDVEDRVPAGSSQPIDQPPVEGLAPRLPGPVGRDQGGVGKALADEEKAAAGDQERRLDGGEHVRSSSMRSASGIVMHPEGNGFLRVWDELGIGGQTLRRPVRSSFFKSPRSADLRRSPFSSRMEDL